jgi:hypothetical protein
MHTTSHDNQKPASMVAMEVPHQDLPFRMSRDGVEVTV